MNGWQRWMSAPATHYLHRLLFQLHLWLALFFGVYLLLISVTGSAVVLRPWFANWFASNQVPLVLPEQFSGEELDARLAEVYSDQTVVRIVPARRAGMALYVLLEQGGQQHSRYFDQYQGEDLGATFPWQLVTVEWLTRFHDELLLGRIGVRLNGIGAVLLLLMCLSGLLLWWQGRGRWWQGLMVRRDSKRSLLWQLHSFTGFWFSLLLMIWALTAIYFAWPEPFELLVDVLDDNPDDFTRPDGWIRSLVSLHFGRFREHLWLSCIWIVLGLSPAFMYISGLLIWYRRVLKPVINNKTRAPIIK